MAHIEYKVSKEILKIITEIAEVNKWLASIIIYIIESDSESDTSQKVKSIIKFIKSNEYK